VLGCTAEALDRLRAYAWPGNVRELENIIERGMILVKGERLDASDLDFGRRSHAQAVPHPVGRVKTEPLPTIPQQAHSFAASAAPTDSQTMRPLSERLADEERREIIAAVDKSESNIALAARMLGINRSTLYYRMRKHGLEHLLPTKTTVGPSPELAAPATTSDPEQGA
jgi:DNA-binding NtrC family response regulator